MTERARFDVYLNLPATGIRKAGECVLQETGGRLTQFAFRYDAAYLGHPAAIPLDPAQLPLTNEDIQLACLQGMPALIDDYLPDAWGRKVLARYALVKNRKRLNVHSAREMLNIAGSSRLGCLRIIPNGEDPRFPLGHPINELAKAERLAQRIDDDDFVPESVGEMELALLTNSGTDGAGGARPKSLFYDDNACYLAKFNKDSDPFNHARIELACLQMARAAGIDAARGKVLPEVNGREILLLDRFDAAPNGGRFHLITVNGLLKDPNTQRDPGHSFRYDDVRDLVSRYSIDPGKDIEQLLKLMLFNRCIHNTDDHERNFSLINRGDGFRLSPAYDLLPSLRYGEFHAAGFEYEGDPPTPAEVVRMGRVFGLSKPTVADCAEQVRTAVSAWSDRADEAGVSEEDKEKIQKRLIL